MAKNNTSQKTTKERILMKVNGTLQSNEVEMLPAAPARDYGKNLGKYLQKPAKKK